LPESPHKP
jgi:hypothetical protein